MFINENKSEFINSKFIFGILRVLKEFLEGIIDLRYSALYQGLK